MQFSATLQDNSFGGVLTLGFVLYHKGNTKRPVTFLPLCLCRSCYGKFSWQSELWRLWL